MCYADDRSASVLTVFTILTWSTVLTRSAVLTVLSVLAMIDSHLARLTECDNITDLFCSLINRVNTCYIVIVLKSVDNSLKSLDVLVHLLALRLKRLVSVPSRDLDLYSIAENEHNIILA